MRINEKKIADNIQAMINSGDIFIVQAMINSGDIFIVNRNGIFALYNAAGEYLGTEEDLVSVYNVIKAFEARDIARTRP